MSNHNRSTRQLSPDYFEIRFRTDAVVGHWPGTFVIISAYATTGETWTRDANEGADRALAAELAAQPAWHVRITGYSPTTGHAEPSWAIEMPIDEARETGRRFKQDAIFVVHNNALSVTGCEAGADVCHVGDFLARVDGRL